MVGELNRLVVFDGFQLVTQGALVCLLFSHSGTLSIIPFPTPAVFALMPAGGLVTHLCLFKIQNCHTCGGMCSGKSRLGR